MSEITKRVCDVFPGARDVERIRVVVMLADSTLELGGAYFDEVVDLSQRGRDRLRRFVQRGVTLAKRKPKAVEIVEEVRVPPVEEVRSVHVRKPRQSKADASSDQT